MFRSKRKTKVREALKELGTVPSQVACRLHHLGYWGGEGSRNCPVFRYLRDTVGGGIEEVVVGRTYLNNGSIVQHPEVIQSFILLYDRGGYDGWFDEDSVE